MKLLAQLGCQFLESSFLVLTNALQLFVLLLNFKELLKTKKPKQNNKKPDYSQIVLALLLRKLLLLKLILLRKARA